MSAARGEVHSDNCQARFIAWYRTEEDAGTEVVDLERCGWCGGDSFRKDNFKDWVIQLLARV
jgi:hypothetical protein